MVDLTADNGLAPAGQSGSHDLPTRQWRNRRRTIFGALVFIGLALAYLLLFGRDDSRLHETLAFGLMTGGFGIISTYVFGAVWDDKNLLALKK